MTSIRAAVAAAVFALCACLAPHVYAAPVETLTAQDAQLYASAFQAAERGDVATVDATLAQVKDPVLVGRVEFVKLTAPASRSGPSYGDLVGWLTAFKDLPGADTIYALAMRLKPQGAQPPPPQASVLVDADGLRGRATPQSRAAREAYFDGNLAQALNLARASGDLWFAGLAAWRLGSYAEAITFFEAVARNAGESDAARAGGAFWAARAAEAAGQRERVAVLLRAAASRPDTFYGMIAQRRLDLADDPLGRAIDAALPAAGQNPFTQRIGASGLDSPAVIALVRSDSRARRAIALMQVGRPVDAGTELRTGLALAEDADQRAAWTSLVFALNPNRTPGARVEARAPTGQATVYPTPALTPRGGFTVNRALVYAVTWQESRFDSLAVSPVGALGLMQVMPTTAAATAGDDGLKIDPMPLLDPATNMRLGQQYIGYLVGRATGGDLLRAVAAYNGGEAVVGRTETALGPDADTLLVVESLPFYETRAYVQKVLAAYWSYRRQFGQPSATLDAAASGARVIDARLDL